MKRFDYVVLHWGRLKTSEKPGGWQNGYYTTPWPSAHSDYHGGHLGEVLNRFAAEGYRLHTYYSAPDTEHGFGEETVILEREEAAR